VNSSFVLADHTSERKIEISFIDKTVTIDPIADEAMNLYSSLCLEEKGLSLTAFKVAFKGFRKLTAKNVIDRPTLLTICDFSQSSKKKRLYIIDMENHSLVKQTYVAHGKNSGQEYATRFSNKPSSLQSSLGFYKTMNTYHGEHGLSLRVKGLEPGVNDKAYNRAIVIHGADYIEESWLSGSSYMGRSYGCPAVPKSESKEIINTIKNGTLVFVYHPSRSYNTKSKILND
jgi:hypothetical protein